MRTYLIDGYNLGHKIPTVVQLLRQKDFYAAIERIVFFVSQRLNTRQNRVIVVFDGQKGIFNAPLPLTSVEIKFSRKPQEADDIIRAYLRKAADASLFTVVSSDAEILKTARDLGAKFIRSEEFYRTAPRTPSQTKPVEGNQKYNPENVDLDYWLRLFGEAPDEES